MGKAVLSVWDEVAGAVQDFPVTWENSPRTDAKIKMPKRYESLWKQALSFLRRDHKDGVVVPYPTVDLEVPISSINKNAHGFFALAVEVFGVTEVGWRLAPPMPDPVDSDPEVEQ